jgi:hypothetical protein
MVDMVQTIYINDQEKNLPLFSERVHLWTTVKVSFCFRSFLLSAPHCIAPLPHNSFHYFFLAVLSPTGEPQIF